jgi:hypothetical protein
MSATASIQVTTCEFIISVSNEETLELDMVDSNTHTSAGWLSHACKWHVGMSMRNICIFFWSFRRN